VLGIARIAAIMGAKRTSDLVPLCHPLALTRVTVDFETDEAGRQRALPRAGGDFGKTGVEMEALTAVQVGLLTDLRHVQGGRPRHGDERSGCWRSMAARAETGHFKALKLVSAAN
jgi:hypothetical protein